MTGDIIQPLLGIHHDVLRLLLRFFLITMHPLIPVRTRPVLQVHRVLVVVVLLAVVILRGPPGHADELPSLARPPVLLLELPAVDGLGNLDGERAAAAQGQHQVQRRAALELVVGCCLVVDPVYKVLARGPIREEGLGWGVGKKAHLLAAVDETLLNGWDALLLLDFLFDLGYLELGRQWLAGWFLVIVGGRCVAAQGAWLV